LGQANHESHVNHVPLNFFILIPLVHLQAGQAVPSIDVPNPGQTIHREQLIATSSSRPGRLSTDA